MATGVSQHVGNLVRHLRLFKKFIFCKTEANFTEISRKHVFTGSNRNAIKNIV